MLDFGGSCRLRHSKDSGHGTLHDAIGAESPKSKATEVLLAVCDRQTTFNTSTKLRSVLDGVFSIHG